MLCICVLFVQFNGLEKLDCLFGNGCYNSYAILELVEMPKGAIYLYYKRGRVGDRLHNSERLDEMDNPKAAVKEFVKLFQQLTGNEFEPWEREKKIEKKRNKFYPIDMVYKERRMP